MRKIVALKRILYDAFGHFNDDDGWSMASHLAITALMALFPFLIFATTLASFLGADAFADTAVHLVFDTWPELIAEPIAREVTNVLTVQRGDLLTYGAVLSLFFASNGVEALRTSLNSAYRDSREARRRFPVNYAHMNPEDMRADGIAEGDTIEIASEYGRIRTLAKGEVRLRRGVVSMTHMFGPLVGSGDPVADGGANVGQLTSLTDKVQPINFMPRYSAVPVNVRVHSQVWRHSSSAMLAVLSWRTSPPTAGSAAL